MSQVKLDLKVRTDSELLTFANAHANAMAGNASYTTPLPTVVALGATISAYDDALTAAAAAEAAWQTAVSDKDDQRTLLELALTSRGRYVEETSGGDETKILSSGFGVRAVAAPIGELPAPENLRASFGDLAGEIDLIWDRVRGARSYVLECRATTPGAPWTQAKIVTRSRATVPGLTPGATYAFRVRAVGAAGDGAWSDEATRMAP